MNDRLDAAWRISPHDTIAAIATASGPAGIGIVRLSGPEAFGIADKLLGPSRRSVAARRGHSLNRESIYDPLTGAPIDDTLIAVFHAPRSFTGENVVEIQGHGGSITLKLLFSACLTAGARPARPGEFSERAFTNGKLDLAQAEAVAEIVNAETVEAQRAALQQANGSLSRELRAVAQTLKSALAAIEASIDFPEDVGDIDVTALDALITRAGRAVAKLLGTATYGRRLREGLRVVLTGRPNVGKSSLLNALSGTDRAIVTATPGTTRDIVEEVLSIHGIPVRALDTAGIRETNDPVERIGVERALAAVKSADVCILVVDATAGLTKDDLSILESLRGTSFVISLNKSDLVASGHDRTAEVKSLVLGATGAVVATSTYSGDGLEELVSAIAVAAGRVGDLGSSANAAPLVTSARHEEALRRAAASIADAAATLGDALPPELIAVDIHGALQSLGEITGESAREDIIASIFATFCIGK